METHPTSIVSECSPAKPKLLVFDDDVAQLESYCMKFSKHYTVEGVLVSDCDASDAVLKRALATGEWSGMAAMLHVDVSAFDCVNHVVCNHGELQDVLQTSRPDFVVSDYQMRRTDEPLMGTDVMHAVAMLVPECRRALHTGSGCALTNRKINDLPKHEFDDRMALVKTMQTDQFRVFPKSPYHRNFDPAPIEAYFRGTEGRVAG